MTEKNERADEGQVDRTYKRTEVDRLGSVAIFDLLAGPLPQEALKEDKSRGFPLTSIKAGFILERLNEVFGLLGYGWRYSHSRHHFEQVGGKNEVLVEVALQWRVGGPADEVYCPPIHWGQTVAPEGRVAEGWYFRPDLKVWSEPIYATGGSNTDRTGSVPLTDAFRAAVTNGITKIAARMGVGNAIYKGQSDAPPASKKAAPRRRPAQPGKATEKTAKTNVTFQTLTAMKKAAQAEVMRLRIEDGEPDVKLVQSLVHKKDALGLSMVHTRLIQTLLEEGPHSQKRVMGTYNFLCSAKLSPENIEILNAAAWAEGKDSK